MRVLLPCLPYGMVRWGAVEAPEPPHGEDCCAQAAVRKLAEAGIKSELGAS